MGCIVKAETTSSPLGRYRVLDLTDVQGLMCGKILSELGADVIKIEKPGGDLSRNNGPFFHDKPHPQKSIHWFALNANKRSITLNIEYKDGQEIFKKLIKAADFIIESLSPGYLVNLGLDYSELSKTNPKIILTSITPFGQSGPYKDYKGCDIVYEALGGFMYCSGDPDRAPLRISVEQAYLQAGAQAAAATMIAHYYRLQTGEGQFIDISIHEAAVQAAQWSSFWWEGAKHLVHRAGNRAYRAGFSPRIIWPCKDGYFSWRIFVAQHGLRTKAMVDWMNSEGMGTKLKDIVWESLDFNQVSVEQFIAWEQEFSPFFLQHTKSELFEEAGKRGFILFPANDIKDIAENRHLQARGFWTQIEHPELGTSLTYPGATAIKSSELYYGPGLRAPLIGEHNEEVYVREMGFSKEEMACLTESGVI